MKLLDKIFGNQSQKEIKKLLPIVSKINDLEESFSLLSDLDLKQKTIDFKERIKNGQNVDDFLPEVFATVREASKRTLGLSPPIS